MKRAALVVLALSASPAFGGEFALAHGKGVAHNPNADSFAVTYRAAAYEYGAASVNTNLPQEFGRAFVAVHAARVFEYRWRAFYASAALGAALAQRTADNAEYAVAPYVGAFVGVRHKGVSVGFGQWAVYRPNLTYKWEAGHAQAYHAAGERWNSPVFLGLRVGVALDVRRSE